MEFKEAVKEIGKKPMEAITWEDCKEELEKVINTRNAEYEESFRKARVQEAQIMLQKYVQEHPIGENESREDYIKRCSDFVKDFVDQMPDEFARNLRTYCHTMGAVFTQLQRLNAEIVDFKEVYLAIHEKDIKEYAENHKDEIEAQRKALAEAQVQQERHERAVARKEALKNKIKK